jgi:hypothetical protein
MSKRKLTPEEKAAVEADENDRTTETGLYHYAVSYNGAADFLGKAPSLEVTHPDEPREFLYAHAIEVYFKAFLRNHGLTVQKLRTFGHDLGKLSNEYLKRGGSLSERDRWVLSLLAASNANHELRYIRTGYYQKAPLNDISQTALNLRKAIGKALKDSGRIVRWYDSDPTRI